MESLLKMNGLSVINVELTDKCDHKCSCCGRRAREKSEPSIEKTYGFMDYKLVQKLSFEIPKGITIQFHNNGDPLLYPALNWALSLFPNNIRCFNTKASALLAKKRDEVIGLLETITISNIPSDPDWKNQLNHLENFLRYKGGRKPFVILRLTGEISRERVEIYEKLAKEHSCLIARRVLHSPKGSFNYQKRQPTIPETGICWDFLNHLAVNKDGDVSICVRYDPNGDGVLGNLKESTLADLWNGPKRKAWLDAHKCFQRNKVPLCSKCEFWGVPTGV